MQAFSGSGPGLQAPDGCSVELYRRLQYLGELEELLPLLTVGSSILELGCGTGRLCRRLAEAGLRVTGVDESPEMLALLPPGVAAVHARIESLELDRSFNAVLLASQLINHPDGISRRAFLDCARRHLRAGGVLLVQRHDPQWLRIVEPGWTGHVGEIEICVETVIRSHDRLCMTLRYEADAQTWRHSFSTAELSSADIEGLLRDAGFSEFSWYGQRQRWVAAIAQP